MFLAYGTTASVARLLGAGDRRAALAQGIDGVWLAVLIGLVVTVVGVATTGPLVRLLGADAEVADPATTYLRIAFLGTTPLLVMLATTGVLRGLQDTRTPLVVAVAGNALNIVLNLLLVYGLGSFDGMGIAGSALGSVLAQLASAGALLAVVVRGARREGAEMRPDLPGIRAAARSGVALVIRTVTLRAALLLTTYAVVLGADGSSGDQSVSVATHQLAFTIWSFLAFALDAVAIAAQAITGRYLGAGDRDATRDVTRRMVRWGAVGGVVTGLLLAAASPLLGPLFSGDDRVHDLLVPVLLVAALGQPIAAVVFVLDGVLIGAGDGTYLAWAGVAVLAVYAPVVLAVGALGGGVVLVWVSLSAVLMGARLVVLVHRARGDAWLRHRALVDPDVRQVRPAGGRLVGVPGLLDADHQPVAHPDEHLAGVAALVVQHGRDRRQRPVGVLQARGLRRHRHVEVRGAAVRDRRGDQLRPQLGPAVRQGGGHRGHQVMDTRREHVSILLHPMSPRHPAGLPVMTTGHIDPRYGDASATPPDWDDVERRLTDAQLYWLVTVRADGRPHAVPLCGVWHAPASLRVRSAPAMAESGLGFENECVPPR